MTRISSIVVSLSFVGAKYHGHRSLRCQKVFIVTQRGTSRATFQIRQSLLHSKCLLWILFSYFKIKVHLLLDRLDLTRAVRSHMTTSVQLSIHRIPPDRLLPSLADFPLLSFPRMNPCRSAIAHRASISDRVFLLTRKGLSPEIRLTPVRFWAVDPTANVHQLWRTFLKNYGKASFSLIRLAIWPDRIR